MDAASITKSTECTSFPLLLDRHNPLETSTRESKAKPEKKFECVLEERSMFLETVEEFEKRKRAGHDGKGKYKRRRTDEEGIVDVGVGEEEIDRVALDTIPRKSTHASLSKIEAHPHTSRESSLHEPLQPTLHEPRENPPDARISGPRRAW